MVSDINIRLEVDATAAKATLADVAARNDDIARQIAQNRMDMIRLQKMGVRIAHALMGLFRSLISAFGISMNAMGRALMNTIDNIIALAGAWLMFMTARASGGDVLAGFGLGTASLSLGISIGAGIRIAEGVEQAEAQAAKADAVLSSIESLARAPGRWGTY